MKAVGQHVRIAVFEYAPGTMDAIHNEAESSFMELVRQQPGLIELAVVKVGDDTSMVVSTWQSREHGEQWAPKGFAWLTDVAKAKEHVRSNVVYNGEVILAENAS